MSSDAATALFDLTGLSPGRVVENCLRVADDAAPDTVLHLSAVATGSLAEVLAMEVAVGAGGRYGDCAGFDGTTIYTGTLAGFAADHAVGPGLAAGPGGGLRTFRLSFSVLDTPAAQGLSAGASFTWTLSEGPHAPPAPAAPGPGASGPGASGPGASRPGAPDPAGPDPTRAGTSPSDDAPAYPPQDRDDGGSATVPGAAGTTPVGPRDGQPGPGGTSEDEPVVVPARAQPGWAERLAAVLARGARVIAPRAGLSLLLLLLVGAFLAVQDRLDRRDPKLALAAVRAPPRRQFLPPLPPPATGRRSA